MILWTQELPPIEYYSPTDYNAENQNWAISQSSDKHIFVGNNSGLLEFDGAKWQLHKSPNNSTIRSVHVLEEKIYTGCYREFGYWLKNDFGSLDYYSLSDKIGEGIIEDENIWHIVDLDDWILFQSLQKIYIYNTTDESFNIINSESQIPKVFKVNDWIYFQKMNEGIYRLENGNPVLINNDEILKNNIVENIFYIDEKILLQTQESGFYFLNESGITKWEIPANEVISAINVYSSLQLKDGTFVLGTISNGIYQLDKDGNIIKEINQKNGLINNTILSMYEDQEQNLWLGSQNGISTVNFGAPFTLFHDTDGKTGEVYASVIFKDKLYLGTNQGLFCKPVNSDSGFTFIEGTKGQVWCLKVFDDTLFCGHNEGTFIVEDDKAELIIDIMGTWDILQVPTNKNLLVQGHYNGLNVLEKINDTWQFRNEIEGFDNSCRYFGLIEDNLIFVNHEFKGVFKLSINDDFTRVVKYEVEESISKGLKSSLIEYNKEIIYMSEEGVFKFNKLEQRFFKDSVLSSSLFTNDNYVSGKLIVDTRENSFWAFTDKNIVRFTPGKLNKVLRPTKIPIAAASRRFILGYENISYLNNRTYLFGTSFGYILMDLDKLTDKSYEVKINSIQKSILNDERTPLLLSVEGELNYRENNIYFSYRVPDYDKFMQVNYQYQLEGIYNDWSERSSDSEVSFKNLPYGNYTFNVKAQIGNKESENIASYTFKIKRPFVFSNFMIAVYGIIFVILWFMIHNLYKRHYNKQKHRLLEKEQRIFSLSQLQNEKVIMKLRNDKLRQDIDSKSRELGASAMSVIKKNELLNTILTELVKAKHNRHVHEVIEIINQSLTDTSDWELFQEAFNNADSKFLKKVKTLHPALTPNDLRLCAYLRLNLSSKEIAPLLNISPRSVEIKRYRLRKKMELSHKKSLVEYILEI
jgi:DNA-binding CsgD family transcriptional regulator